MDNSTSLNCDYFESSRCRSCSLLDKSAPELPKLPEALTSTCENILPWVRCSKPFGTRAKAKLSVTGTSSQAIIGILDSELQGIELLKCPLHKTAINQLLGLLPELINEVNLAPYSIEQRSGELKGVIVQTNQAENHLRLRFVLRTEESLDKISKIAKLLANKLPQKISITANIQPIAHQIPEGPTEHHLYGEELLWETYNNIDVAFPAQSFMQVTPEIAASLYKKAAEIIASLPNAKLVDLFCGAGGFALSAASHCREVIGVELSEPAISAARKAAARNGLKNVSFHAASVAESLAVLRGATIVVCNPPRRGIGEEVIKALLQNKPKLILYSSCNVESLLQDFKNLKNEYTFSECTPFEMFPLTTHYELLAVLKRR